MPAVADIFNVVYNAARGSLVIEGAAGGVAVPTTSGAGTALIGKVGIDQTTPGTTNAVSLEGTKTSYSASVTGLAPAVTATDIFTIAGSATKTVRITRIQISGVATAAGAYAVQLIKRSVADTVGTLTNPTIVPHDSANAAATAVVAAYTAHPTLGAAVGTMQVKRITVSTAAGAIPIVPTEFSFELRGEQAIVLRGVAQQLSVNLNGVTMAGGALDVDCSFTEEA